MKTLRYCLTTLLLLVNTLMSMAADDIIVNITPVQPVLPPQIGQYISNPGAYFNVTVTNTTPKQAFLYFGMTLSKLPNTTDPMVYVPGNRMPKTPTVALAANETRLLNLTEMRQMFNHLAASDIITQYDYSSGFASGQFGLLEEGEYRIQLNVYKWSVEGNTDILLTGVNAVTTNGKNSCQFTVRYKVDAPKFVNPIRPMGVSLDALNNVAELNPLNPMFAWTETVLTGARPVYFYYDFKVVEVGPGQDPEDAWIHETHVLYKKENLTSATAVIPQNVIRMMDKNCTYAARVTAKQRNQVGMNNMGFTLVANEGRSDLMIFKLKSDKNTADDTSKDTGEKDKDTGEKDKDNDSKDKDPKGDLELKFGFGSKEGTLTDSIYNFCNPEILSPSFNSEAGARKIFVNNDILVEWKRARYVGGIGTRQDSVKLSYDVQIFRGDPSLSNEENFKGEPIYSRTTEELRDSIPWETINGDVNIGDYLILRVKPKSVNTQSVAFVNDTINVVDFALSDRISQKFFQCSAQISIDNTIPTKKSASDFKGKVVGIGQYQLKIDEISKSKQGFKGRGRVEWRPLGLKVMIAVEFDSLCINTDDIVYSGMVRGRKDDNYYSHNGEQVDRLFSEWGLDNLIGDTRLPFADKLQKEASQRGREFAKSMGIGNYYKWYHDAKDFLSEGKLDNLCLPIKLPEKIGKVPVDLQIVNVTFAPTWASMDLMGTFMLPNSSHIKNEVLVLGAPHLCISPERLLPEGGAICLLSDFTLTEQDSQFDFTFKSPSDITVTNNGKAPDDGCYISWANDTLSAFMLDVEMTVPNLKKVDSNGKVTEELPKVYVKWGVRDWNDWTAKVAMDNFEADDLPGWTFIPGKMVYDHSSTKNDEIMGKFPATYDKSKSLTANKMESWQGLYISEVGVQFPKSLTFGSADSEKRTSASIKNMFFDKSGVTLSGGIDNAFDAVTGKFGGWAFSIDKVSMDIVQSTFNGCYFTGGIGVPLLGGKDNDGKNIDYRCDIYNQKTLKGSKNKNGYTYVFKVEPKTDELALDFFLAEAKIDKSQTYFLLEAEDQDDGKTQTHVEMCLGGVMEIQGPTKISPYLPDIHFVGMRIANFPFAPKGREAWKSAIASIESKRQKAQEVADSKITFCEKKEMELGKECYFNAGQWSLSSMQKKLGPFKFTLADYEFRSDLAAKSVSLYLKGQVSIVDGVFDASAGITISAGVDIENLDLSYKGWNLDELSIGANFGVVKLNGRFDIRTEGEDEGLGGALEVTMPGDLFKVTVDGGCFEHDEGVKNPKPSEKYTWGYFYGELNSKAGIGMDPVKITGIKFGLFFNCSRGGSKDGKVDLSDTKNAAVPKYGITGIIAGLNISAISEETLSGKFDMTVIYQKGEEGKSGYLSTFMLNGNVEGAGGLVNTKASIVYQCDDVDKYFQLNVTFETGGTKLDKLTEGLDKLTKKMQELNNQFDGFEKNLKASLPGLNGNTDNKTESGNKPAVKDADTEKPKGAVKAMESSITFDFRITFRADKKDLPKPKWHVYIGEPDYKKRCKITFIDFDAKIVTVKVGANAYICLGNELPNNGQLPPLPTEISEFLNGGSKGGVESASAGDADRARQGSVKDIMGTVDGGVMLGAQVYGFIKFDLGLIFADMGVQAGFDLSLRHLKGGWCTNLNHGRGAKPGHNGWYAEGQMYAYLYAVLNLRIRLGFYNTDWKMLDAGIGGMFKCGLPNPNYAVGKARIKLKMFGGLVKIDRKFSFECGEVCQMFYGNPLDNFILWSEMSIGSERRREGWDYNQRISPELGKRPTLKSNANLNQHYRLLDENERARLENDGISADDISALASRTFIFRNSNKENGKYVAYLYSYTDSASAYRDSLHVNAQLEKTVEFYRGDETASQHLLDLRRLKPNRFYVLKVEGCAKQIEAGKEVDPYTVETNKDGEVTGAKHKAWSQTKYYYFRTSGEASDKFDPTDENFNLNDYVALAYPSYHNKLQISDKDLQNDSKYAENGRIKAHIIDMVYPNIALTREFKKKNPSDKLVWNQYVWDEEERTRTYRHGRGGRVTTVKEKVNVRKLYHSEDAVIKNMTFTYPGAETSVRTSNIITSKPLGIGNKENGKWIADLSLDYITTRTMTRTEEVEKEKVTNTPFARIVIKANGGTMPSVSVLAMWRSQTNEIRQILKKAGAKGVYNPTASGSGGLRNNDPVGSKTAGKGNKQTTGSGSTQTLGKSKVVNTGSNMSSPSSASNILKRWKTNGLTDNEVDKLLTGLENNTNMYNTSTYTVTEDVPYEVRDTINLLYLPLSCSESTWYGGIDNRAIGAIYQYEEPFATWKFVDFERQMLEKYRTMRYTDASVGMAKDGKGRYLVETDPLLYLSWISNYAFVGGWKAQLKKYNIGVTTTESLLATGSGGYYGGRYGQASEDRVVNGPKDIFKVFFYNPDTYYFPVRELDNVEDNVALLTNDRMFAINPWNCTSKERYSLLVAEATRNIGNLYGLASRVSSQLTDKMQEANKQFSRYKTEKGKLKDFVSKYLNERNGLYISFLPSEGNMVSQSSTTSFSQRGEYCKAYVPYYQMALTTPLLDPADIFEFEGQNQISKGRFKPETQKLVWNKLADENAPGFIKFNQGLGINQLENIKVQAYRVNGYDLNSGEYSVNPELYDVRDENLGAFTAPVINIVLATLDDRNAKGFEPRKVSEINNFSVESQPGSPRPVIVGGGNKNTSNPPKGTSSKSSTDLKMNNTKPVSQVIEDMKMEKTIEDIRNGNIRIDVGNGNSSKKEANSTPELPSTLIKVGTITDNDIKKAETERRTRVTGPINTGISKADTTSTSGSSSSMKKADSISSPRSTGSGAQKSSTAITQQKKSTTEINTATQQRKSTTNTATQQKRSTTKSATWKSSVPTTSSSSSRSKKSAATVRKRR